MFHQHRSWNYHVRLTATYAIEEVVFQRQEVRFHTADVAEEKVGGVIKTRPDLGIFLVLFSDGDFETCFFILMKIYTLIVIKSRLFMYLQHYVQRKSTCRQMAGCNCSLALLKHEKKLQKRARKRLSASLQRLHCPPKHLPGNILQP